MYKEIPYSNILMLICSYAIIFLLMTKHFPHGWVDMRFFNTVISLLLVSTLGLGLIPARPAFAAEEITADTPMPNLAELQEKVEAASAVYDEANRRIAEVEEEIKAIEVRIEELQAKIPEARQVSNEAAREYYRMLSGSNYFLEILFGATSMTDFFAKVEYTNRVNQSLLDDITTLANLNAEMEEIRSELEATKARLEEEREQAEDALEAAQEAHRVAEETAHAIILATEIATAEAAAAAAAEAHTPEPPLTPGGGGPGMPEAPPEKQEFVNLWTPRIDAYLAGSPLAGYGYAFANAAFDYNVDPRWSPAIACVESSKGLFCYRAHNAWGWGSIDWPNWETAIYEHVRGLSRGYGYTVSYEAALKYCPYNADHWFNHVSNQMALI